MNSLYNRKCFDEVFKESKLYQPDLIGITTLSLSARNSYRLAQKLSSLNIPIIGGGLHMSLYPEEALSCAPFDLIVRNEADESIFEVVDCYRNGRSRKDIE